MPNETVERPGSSSLVPTIIRLIDSSIKEGEGLDNLITILSLLCLISVFTRQQSNSPASSPASSAKEKEPPVNKLIENLMKGVGGGGGGSGGGLNPEMLMSLLPLLNNPQVKSKLNPGTISSVLGMLNNFGGSASEKPSAPKEKKTEIEPEESAPSNSDNINARTNSPSAAQPSSPSAAEEAFSQEFSPDDSDPKNQGRYLNWKTNF